MGSSEPEGVWRVFWAWVEGATGNMVLALQGLVERVRSWTVVGGLSGLGLASGMDTLNTLLIGWLTFVGIILIIGSFFYVKFVHNLGSDDAKKKTKKDASKGAAKEVKSSVGELTAGPKQVVEPARKPTIVPDGPPERVSPPVGTGADPDAVRWTNNVFTWLYNSADGGPHLSKNWLETVNENTVKTALETGILVEVVELLPETPAPTLSNVVVDCSPTDDITITCDCDATIYLRLVTTRTQGDNTTESEYACAVRPLRGRLNVAFITHDLVAVTKFDGWPEVSLELEGIRNNATGLGEQQMLDVIDEVLSSALRNSVLDFNFQRVMTFPRFRRARQAPDPIIPVGYDAMVRELQTHPPSVPHKPPAVALHHGEEIEEAGESFTALTFSNNLSQQIALTTSEEQLIARNLTKYPSLENTQMGPEEIAECLKTWEENYVPAADVPVEEEEKAAVEEPIPVPENKVEDEPPQTQNFVLVASNRSKLIDEPRNTLTVEEIVDEEEPELVATNIEDEPCLRRREGSPLLGKPRIEEPKSFEEEDEDPEIALRLAEMEFTDTSLTSTSGFGPLPSLPGLPKGPFVSAQQATTPGQSMGIPGLNGKRLLVKIVKAVGVGCDKTVAESYAVVEMDEPAQKFTTAVVKDTNSPFWDEQFLFDLSDGTLEILFELYDKKEGNFLGLGIVGIEELVATPSQRQIIPLQSRPYEDDEVSGSLTVEFLFLDRADLPDLTLRSSATSQSLSSKGDLVTTTTTTYVKAPESQDVIVNGGDSVAAAALRDIEEKKVIVANNASKSTMIIHASRKPGEEDEYVEPSEDLTALTTTATTTTMTITTSASQSTTTTTTSIGSPTITSVSTAAPITTTITTTTTTNADAPESNENDERGRSRGSRRKRDSFFGTLKKRFSRSKIRSKSMDPGNRDASMDRDASVGRSVSMERTANPNRASGLLTVPANVGGGDGGSTRSSLSEASAISSSSTRTYVNEASTLIIETNENGVLKHYLIPLALQQKSKWRKKGLKLHIFGEHTFVAKHMSSSTPCQVCQKTLGRRFGKQGYECRDCGFKSHKPCHVKTDTVCPNSTVNSMDLTPLSEDY